MLQMTLVSATNVTVEPGISRFLIRVQLMGIKCLPVL